MATNDDTKAFAKRLNQALKRSPKKISSPSELALRFNLVYSGRQITNQAAQKWMTGLNKPAPDKIEILAKMLRVSVQWLRYGIPEAVPPSKRITTFRSSAKGSTTLLPDEVLLIERLRVLPEHQRQLVTDLVELLALQTEMWQG